MQRLYRPPRFAAGGGKRKPKTTLQPAHSPVWIVPLQRFDLNDRQKEQADNGRPKARKRLRFPRRSFVDEMFWNGTDLIGRLQEDHMVIQVTEELDKRMVSPQGRVLHIEEYKDGRTRWGVVFLEVPKLLRRKNLTSIVARLGREAKILDKLQGPRVLRDPALTHSLLNLWSDNRA